MPPGKPAASPCRFIGDYEQALTWSRQAMAAAEGRDVDLWAHAVHGVAVMLRSLGRLTEALTTTEAAVERLPAGVSPGLVADLHQVLAFAYCVRGDLDESARATDEALRLAPPHEVEARSSALLNRGQLALIRLEPSAARAVFRSVRLVLLIGGHAGARTAPGAGGTRALDRPPARGRDRARGAAVSRRE